MRLLTLAICLLLAAPSMAQKTQTADLQEIEFLKLSPAFNDYWTDYVRRFETAQDQLRQAALLAQCDRISGDRSLSLDPELRRAVEEVMKSNAQLINAKDPQTARHLNRFSLYALSRLTPKERTSLNTLAKDKEMLKYVANLYVLEDFQSYAIDPVSGQLEPAAVIWLRTYFQKEGRLAQLNKALHLTRPALVKNLEQLQPLEKYAETDRAALSSLTGELLQDQNTLADSFAQQIPKAVVPRLQDFYAHPFHEWLGKARAAEGDPMSQAMGKELSADLAVIRDELKAKYPAPAGLQEKLLRMGPGDYAGKQVERFCPPKKG